VRKDTEMQICMLGEELRHICLLCWHGKSFPSSVPV